jgi:hypothetical protein
MLTELQLKPAILLLLALLTFSSTAYPQEPEPRGNLVFSVELVGTSGIERSDGTPITFMKTGIFYYIEEARPGDYGALLTGYRFANGQVIDVVGEGSIGSEAFLNRLQNLPLRSFDVAVAVKETITSLQQKAQREGGVYSGSGVRDGSEYRISYDFNNVHISYRAWNPGHTLDKLAPYNADIANLRELIDIFAEQYGRRQFGL